MYNGYEITEYFKTGHSGTVLCVVMIVSWKTEIHFLTFIVDWLNVFIYVLNLKVGESGTPIQLVKNLVPC